MATYLAHDALRLPAASLLAYSGLCVNIEIKIWLLLGVNVDTAFTEILIVVVLIVMFYFAAPATTVRMDETTSSISPSQVNALIHKQSITPL